MYKLKQPQSEQEFDDYFSLRWRILRAPWGEPEGSEKDQLEDESFHVMVRGKNNTIVGVGRLQFNSDTEAQIRYMAVEPEHEGNGIGTLIVNTLEREAKNRKCNSIMLEAREPAVGFYEKLGYKMIEKSYLLFDSIQHYRMQKKID